MLVFSTTTSHGDILSEYLPEQCDYSGSFVQKRTINSVPGPLISTGNFLFSCSRGVVWMTTIPIDQAIIYTNANLHFEIDSNTNVKTLVGSVHDTMANLMKALMGGDGIRIIQLFSVNSVDVTNSAIILIPRQPALRKFINSVQLENHTTSMKITITNGRSETTEITTDNHIAYPEATIEHCEQRFGLKNLSCEALFSPERLTSEIDPGR